MVEASCMGVSGGRASGTEAIIMPEGKEKPEAEERASRSKDRDDAAPTCGSVSTHSLLLSPSQPSISSSHSSDRRVSLLEQPGQQRSTFHVRAANSLESAQELRPASSPAADAGRPRGQRRSLRRRSRPTYDGIAVKSPWPEPDGEHGTRLKHSTHPAEHVIRVIRVNDAVAAAASAAETPHSHRTAPHTAHTMHAGPAVAACATLVAGRQGQRTGPADARATGIDV